MIDDKTPIKDPIKKAMALNAVRASCKGTRVLWPSYYFSKKQGILTDKDCKKGKIYAMVVHAINKALRDAFIDGYDITFPCGMGRVYLGKQHINQSNNNGVLIDYHLIDWYETRKLWAKDEEAHRNRVYVRFNNTIFYKICYENTKPFKNHWCFRFQPCMILKHSIAQKAKANELNI